MRKMVLSLFAFVLVGIVPSFASQAGVQIEAQAATEKILTWDVAVDCRTWRTNLGISFQEFGRGDSFTANGKIFPAGALRSGAQSNDPNDQGSIGTFVQRGTMAATLAEISAGTSPAFYATWFQLLDDGRGLVADGPHGPRPHPMAVVGGMGDFRAARGELSAVIIGTNSTGCPNMRLTINLRKQSR